MVGLLNAFPGTRLYEPTREEGRLNELISGDNVDRRTNTVPIMGLDALRQGYRNILQQIYSPKHCYRRTMIFLREYQRPKIRPPLDFQRSLAVLRSSVRLGVLGKERFQYWKLLLWTLSRRPQLFTLAITFAIYGHHFRKISKLNNIQ
jgi:hypothetical protein